MELWKIVVDIAFHVILPLAMPVESKCHATFVPNLVYCKISIPVVYRHVSGISSFIVSKQEPQHTWTTG